MISHHPNTGSTKSYETFQITEHTHTHTCGSLKEEFSRFGNKDGRSTFFASKRFEVLFLFLAGNDVVPIGLTIPYGDLEDVAGTVPLDAESHHKPVIDALEAPIPFEPCNGGQYQVDFGIVNFFDHAKEARPLSVGDARRFQCIQTIQDSFPSLLELLSFASRRFILLLVGGMRPYSLRWLLEQGREQSWRCRLCQAMRGGDGDKSHGWSRH
jgi:hypothetical protein